MFLAYKKIVMPTNPARTRVMAKIKRVFFEDLEFVGVVILLDVGISDCVVWS